MMDATQLESLISKLRNLVTLTCAQRIELARGWARDAATLVAICAPTSLAIERAERLGLTLVAIASSDGAVVFAGALAGPDGEGRAPAGRSSGHEVMQR